MDHNQPTPVLGRAAHVRRVDVSFAHSCDRALRTNTYMRDLCIEAAVRATLWIQHPIHGRLYGCCLGQVVYYFRNFGREDKYIKYLVRSPFMGQGTEA